jgi:hypothetical protein
MGQGSQQAQHRKQDNRSFHGFTSCRPLMQRWRKQEF